MFLSLFVKHTNYIQLHYIAFLLAALEVPKREASLGSNAISVANLWRHRFGLDLRDSLRIFYGILTNCANRFVADLREKAYGFFTDFLRILYGILTNCPNRFVADLREKAYGFFTDSLRNSHELSKQICSGFEREGLRILYGFFTEFSRYNVLP